MIEVEVHYYHRVLKNKNNDRIIYPYFMVKGHANNGSSMECIKVCAGVSACVSGIHRLLDESQYNVTIKHGYFEISTHKSVDDKIHIDEDTNYGLNTLLCQLYEIYMMYPLQFSRFDMIDVKEYEESETYEPKPFRELKKQLGFPSN